MTTRYPSHCRCSHYSTECSLCGRGDNEREPTRLEQAAAAASITADQLRALIWRKREEGQ